MNKLTVQDLIGAGVHFGCRASRWNPKMAPFIHGRRNSVHVINLRETIRGIIRAQNLLYHIVAGGESVLWVGTKRQVKGVIADAGERTGMPIVTERWIGGTLTNFSVIRSRLKRLEQLEAIDEAAAEALKLKKKELSRLHREQRKITRNLGGIREMKGMPGAMVVVDPSREGNAIREARKMGIVLIGILDTDCDPSMVDVVIPGNDDALKSVRLLVDQLVAAVEEGCAHNREQMATVGAAQRHEDGEGGEGEGEGGGGAAKGDGPRPTRGNKPPKRPAKTTAAPAADAPAAPAAEAPAALAAEAPAAAAAEATVAPTETPEAAAPAAAAEGGEDKSA